MFVVLLFSFNARRNRSILINLIWGRGLDRVMGSWCRELSGRPYQTCCPMFLLSLTSYCTLVAAVFNLLAFNAMRNWPWRLGEAIKCYISFNITQSTSCFQQNKMAAVRVWKILPTNCFLITTLRAPYSLRWTQLKNTKLYLRGWVNILKLWSFRCHNRWGLVPHLFNFTAWCKQPLSSPVMQSCSG